MPMSSPQSRPVPWISIAVKAAILHAVMAGGWLVVASPAGGVPISLGLLVLTGSSVIFAYLAYALRRVQTKTDALSDERKSDGQQEATSERDQRLRAICHDMRTPLTAILGFIDKGSNDFQALLVAASGLPGQKDTRLRYVGNVGSGFTETERARMNALLRKRLRPAPIVPCPERGTWIEPGFYCVVSYAELTEAGRLRAPVFEELIEA